MYLPLLLTAIGPGHSSILPTERLAQTAFGADAPWFERNIPFFECSDPQIQKIYYYRWGVYKAHIRDVGERGTIITEFLDDVGWQKWPFASLNDATPFHIKEGRWLRDSRPVDEHIDYLYEGGGNDRHFAEGIAEATYANFLARGDLKFAAKHLPAMRHIYNLWDDHFDFSKGLYWIEPLLDATEYTISSIDASGGKDGFRGGDAFRPSINAYQFGNARAISRLSALTGDKATAEAFSQRANELKSRVQDALWSEKFAHFIDRYQVNNQYVKYWEPIRGRELVGYVPWAYELPDDTPRYAEAWHHLLDSTEFAGPYGLRTVGPSYQYYMRQYRYEGTRPECQWNGPSWPFQTTQVLTGLANLLNDYHQTAIGKADYLRLLRQYADQHVLNGKPNLQEDYNPDTGQPIVGLDRSHHYNHSGFVDLIVTGLAGIRPREDGTLVVNPLVPDAKAMPYLCLENVPYHGHHVTVLWDADGTRYHHGAGLSVYVDGKRRVGPSPLGRLTTSVGRPRITDDPRPLNVAVNVAKQGFPKPSASVNEDDTLWQAVDGRTWFYPEMIRGWTTGAGNEDWFAVDFGSPKTVGHVSMAFYDTPPQEALVQAQVGGAWNTLATVKPQGNTTTDVNFASVQTDRIRLLLRHDRPVRLVELAATAH
jgi:hypothetical protein